MDMRWMKLYFAKDYGVISRFFELLQGNTFLCDLYRQFTTSVTYNIFEYRKY